MRREIKINLTDKNIIDLARKIKNDVFIPISSYITNIFLCGGNLKDTNNLRYKLKESIEKKNYTFLKFFKVIFPEDIFDDLLFGDKRLDLMSLENLLAKSVDVIVIIPESPGSIAELGAFVNNENLREKIICVVDKKFMKKKSFINEGPLRLIKKIDKKSLIFFDHNDNIESTRKVISQIKNKRKISVDIETEKIPMLQLESYILPAIFLLEPVSKVTLIGMVKEVIGDKEFSYQITISTLTRLIKKGKLNYQQKAISLHKKA